MQTTYDILKHYFGYTSFRTGQLEVIEAILNKQDVLAVMPTSAGKSICYQVPAMLLKGTTIVVSPLISLMHDQVTALNEIGIPAAVMNSAQNDAEYRQVVGQLYRNEIKLLYVAPERLNNDYFVQLMSQLDIPFIAVDEAHCISQWGNDFRPAYQNIAQLLEQLPTRPIVAGFTATATQRVRQDICHHLQLRQPFELVTGFDRGNLFFAMEEPLDKMARLLQLIDSKEMTVVYCSTRKDVENVCAKLQQNGIRAGAYHAGMAMSERQRIQRAFQFDEISVIVATNAFGMGIDKSNVRQVIHYSMPKDLESYYQEAGRAGRDGENARCTLFYNGRDIMTNLFFLEQGNDPVGKEKLNDMIDYCRTLVCLRQFILQYFGEKVTFTKCNACTNCVEGVETADITKEAQKILSCIVRMKEMYGMTRVIEVLKGSQRKEIVQLGLDHLPTYGIMKDTHEKAIRQYIGALVADRYLKIVGKDYPILNLTAKAKEALLSRATIRIKRTVALSIARANPVQSRGNETHLAYDEVLFEQLRQLRYELAQQNSVPPFMIFSDATLRTLCRHLPMTELEFLAISGVGQKKLERYGGMFIAQIQRYVKEGT